jgi:hypothetical protein
MKIPPFYNPGGTIRKPFFITQREARGKAGAAVTPAAPVEQA